MEIRPLRETDDRSKFRSGDFDLDRFIGRYAGQNQFRHHLGATYVAVESDRIWGYATIAAGNLERDALPRSLRRALPRYPMPVLRLARLAVDETSLRRGVGTSLLRYVFRLALKMAEGYGCVGILVDARSDAVSFYTQLGFSRLEVTAGEMESRPKPTPLFLPLDLVAAALK